MKFFLFLFSVIFFSCLVPPATVTGQSAAPSPEKIAQQGKQARSQKISSEMDKKSSEKTPKTAPTTFRPTEKIGADTVIAFPADI